MEQRRDEEVKEDERVATKSEKQRGRKKSEGARVFFLLLEDRCD